MSPSDPYENRAPSNNRPQPSDAPPENNLVSNVANSASGLLNSIARPSPSAATSALNSAASSSSKSSQQDAAPSSTADSLSWSQATDSRRAHNPGARSEFRSQPGFGSPSIPTAEGDFALFVSADPPTAMASAYHQPSCVDLLDGADVAALLSSPLAASEVYMDDIAQVIQSLDASHPIVVAFAECEDPVEFLQARPDWSQYTESVWGNLLQVLEGVGKGKGTDDDEGKAIERLKLVWGHLNAKL